MKAMVLAAGRGERMRPLTDVLPKPLISAGGRPLIEYHLAKLARAGCKDVVINTGWLGHVIRKTLGDGSRLGVSIEYSIEPPGALDVGGGIRNAIPLLGASPFLVISADVWTDIDFHSLRRPLPPNLHAHLVLVDKPEYKAHGDFHLDEGLLHSGDGAPYCYSGVGLFREEFFAKCPPGRLALRPLFERACATGRMSGELHRGDWLDVGTPDRLAALDERLRSGEYRAESAY
jgi:MurNAc alpha-1-phosphate uridylyltransferase